jgi:hypothetical protein
MVVRSTDGWGEATFSGAVSATVAIDGGGPGARLQAVDYSADGVAATLHYAAHVPDPTGSSLWVHSLTRLSSSRDDTIGWADAGFFIEFEVDATQDYRFAGGVLDGWGDSDGRLVFEDLTAQETLFAAFFADTSVVDMTILLQSGHLYQLIAPLRVYLKVDANPSGREWAFRLTALPEPSTAAGLALGGIALLGAGLRRRRRMTSRL